MLRDGCTKVKDGSAFCSKHIEKHSVHQQPLVGKGVRNGSADLEITSLNDAVLSVVALVLERR